MAIVIIEFVLVLIIAFLLFLVQKSAQLLTEVRFFSPKDFLNDARLYDSFLLSLGDQHNDHTGQIHFALFEVIQNELNIPLVEKGKLAYRLTDEALFGVFKTFDELKEEYVQIMGKYNG